MTIVTALRVVALSLVILAHAVPATSAIADGAPVLDLLALALEEVRRRKGS